MKGSHDRRVGTRNELTYKAGALGAWFLVPVY